MRSDIPAEDLPTAAATSFTSSQDGKRPIAFLDGLRGLAALLVYLYHFNVAWYGEDILYGFGQNDHYSFALLPLVRSFYSGGIMAVAIFFVLSGFVLSISCLRSIRDHVGQEVLYNTLISSAIRRPIRLYLPCLLVMWTNIVVGRALPMSSEESQRLSSQSLGIEFLGATWSFFSFFNPLRQHTFRKPFTLGLHYWTIPVELKGSMLVFILLAFSVEQLSPRRDFLRFLLIGLLLHQTGQWTMSLFVFGMCLAMCEVNAWNLTKLPILRDIPRTSHKHFNCTLFFIGWWLCSQVDRNVDWARATPGWHLLTTYIPTAYADEDFVRYWVGYGAILMVYAVLRVHWLQEFLASRPMVWLGKISFVLYLTHPFTVMMIGNVCRRLVGHPPFLIGEDLGAHWYDGQLLLPDVGPMGFNLRWFGALLLTTGPCLVFAHFTTNIYDKGGSRAAAWVAMKVGYPK